MVTIERIEHAPAAQATIAAGWTTILPTLSADPTFVVWKNLDRALRGQGDVDAACPAASGEHVTDRAVDAARRSTGYAVAVVCDHLPGNRLVTFCDDETFPSIGELHLCYQPFRRGVPWAAPAALADQSRVDAGIRRTRPAAEALVALVTHGLSSSGALALDAAEHDWVRTMLRDDRAAIPAAVRSMVPRPLRPAIVRCAGALADGRWARVSALLAFWGFAALALFHPSNLLDRVRARRVIDPAHSCPTIETTTRGRVVDSSHWSTLDDFVQAAARAGDRVVPLR